MSRAADSSHAAKFARPRISVVIPCFNYSRYVAVAIESVLSQGYDPTELIVVNDGSTDDSLVVISRYSDRAHIIDQPNEGHVAACNRGFAASTGDIVVFLDADDLLEPSALSRVAGAFTPSAVKVQYDLRIIDGEGGDLGRRSCYFTRDYNAARVRAAFRETGTYRWPVTAGNAYARRFLDRMFPLTVADAPDGILNTVAPVYGDIVTIPEPLGCYRLHGANRWATDGANPSRLPKRIRVRRDEVRSMRNHAEQRGVGVPGGDVLDHELTFLGYRLMALKLGLDYEGRAGDSPAALLRLAVAAIRRERLPLRMGVAHLAWFGALVAANATMAKGMYGLRAGRSALRQSAFARLAALASRLGCGEKAGA